MNGDGILNNIWNELSTNNLTQSDIDTWKNNFLEVIDRYPKSEYDKKATHKLVLINRHLPKEKNIHLQLKKQLNNTL